MTIPLLTGYIPPFKPVANITPFTYRDGLTYVEVLEELRRYLNKDIIEFINTNFSALAGAFEVEVNKLIDEVNATLESQTEDVDTKIADLTTLVNNAVAGINSLVDDLNDNIEAQNTAIAAQIAAQNATVDARLTDNETAMTTLENNVNNAVTAIQNSAIEISDPVVYNIVSNIDSDTRTFLDGIYNPAVLNDNIVAAIVEDEESDTRAALDTLYDTPAVTPELLDPSVSALVDDTGSDTRGAIDGLISAAVSGIPIVSDASQITTGIFSAARIPNLQNLNGTLTLGKGGTGATTKADARANLGVTNGSAAPNNANGDDGDIYLQWV